MEARRLLEVDEDAANGAAVTMVADRAGAQASKKRRLTISMILLKYVTILAPFTNIILNTPTENFYKSVAKWDLFLMNQNW
jgi:hypothetical protein